MPAIFIYGGSILPGTFKGRPVTVQDVFEAVGKHSVGQMSDSDLDLLERNACPSAGACGAQFTANTMATVSEAIGLALPYSAGAPAPYELRDAFCTTAGEMVMELIAKNIRPRDIVTCKALGERGGCRSQPRAARPMRRCICPPLRMNAASSSRCSMWPKSSKEHRISQI